MLGVNDGVREPVPVGVREEVGDAEGVADGDIDGLGVLVGEGVMHSAADGLAAQDKHGEVDFAQAVGDEYLITTVEEPEALGSSYVSDLAGAQDIRLSAVRPDVPPAISAKYRPYDIDNAS